MELSASNIIVLALILLISAGIGIVYAIWNKNATARDMLIANREMTVFPTSMSLLATFMSGLTILGTPGEIYSYGTIYLWAGVAYIMVAIVTANVFVPLFYNLEITSTYEYLERRFNKWVKLLGSIIFIVQTTVYLGLVLYAPVMALAKIIGNDGEEWIYIIVIGSICILYTSLGGMKAVMWTDVFQIMIMVLGLLVTIILGLKRFKGGIKEIIEISWIGRRIEIFKFDLDPTTRHTIWGLTFGLFFQWLSVYAVNQSQVQRYLSVPNVKTAKRALYWNAVGLIIILAMTGLIGLILYTEFHKCHPVLDGESVKPEELYPIFVLEVFKVYDGLIGLFLGCVFSAALSSISSGLNSLAAVALTDIIKCFIAKNLSTKHETLLSKVLCIIFGGIVLIVSFGISKTGKLLESAIALFGVIGGPVLGLFCLGIFVPFANSKGAIMGTLSSLVMLLWMFIGNKTYKIEYPKLFRCIQGCNATHMTCDITYIQSQEPIDQPRIGIENFYAVSYTWYGLIALLTVLIVGTITSLATEGTNHADSIDANLMIPFFSKALPCLPEKIKKLLECGFSYKNDKIATNCNNTVQELNTRNSSNVFHINNAFEIINLE